MFGKILINIIFVTSSGENTTWKRTLERAAEGLKKEGALSAEIVTAKDFSFERACGNALYLSDDPASALFLKDKGLAVSGILSPEMKDASFPGIKYLFSEPDKVDYDSYLKAWQREKGMPWDILSTKRLLVRETTPEDTDDFYRIYADPSITRYMEGLYEDPEKERHYQEQYIEKVYAFLGFGIWTLVLKESGEIAGRAGFSVRTGFDEPEIGFLIAKNLQGRGLAKEVIGALLDYGRDALSFNGINAFVRYGNGVSIRLLESFGFERIEKESIDGHIRMYLKLTGRK